MEQHRAAREWLDEQLSGSTKVGLAWSSLLAFVRLVTNPRLFAEPVSVPEGWKLVGECLDAEPTWVPVPTDRHREILGGLMKKFVDRSNLVPDAHIAALAIEHGLALQSTDGGFARFEGLTWTNPIGT